MRGEDGLDRDPRVPDTSDDWYRTPGLGVGPCGAIVRDAQGELQRGCYWWCVLTLVRGRWLCPTCAEKDPTRLVWPMERSEQLPMWDAVRA